MRIQVLEDVYVDKLSVPWYPMGELLWSPALSLKMLHIPLLQDHQLWEFCW